LKTKNFSSLVGGNYKVVYADPPWPNSPKERKRVIKRGPKSMGGMTNRSYPQMPVDDLLALRVDEIASKDAVLLLWATWGFMGVALELIDAWGFKYVTGFPWLKVGRNSGFPIFGPGTWLRHASEPLLIARRGKPFGSLGNPRPAREGLVVSPRLEHSRKPESILEWIDELFPAPKVELFARRERIGWDSWGDQL
jgi:N6-adenosine-specific RNA methylase IME4